MAELLRADHLAKSEKGVASVSVGNPPAGIPLWKHRTSSWRIFTTLDWVIRERYATQWDAEPVASLLLVRLGTSPFQS